MRIATVRFWKNFRFFRFFEHFRPLADNLLRVRIVSLRVRIETSCYLKRLCNSLKKLKCIKKGQTIRTTINTYEFKSFVCIPSSSNFFLDKSKAIFFVCSNVATLC